MGDLVCNYELKILGREFIPYKKPVFDLDRTDHVIGHHGLVLILGAPHYLLLHVIVTVHLLVILLLLDVVLLMGWWAWSLMLLMSGRLKLENLIVCFLFFDL